MWPNSNPNSLANQLISFKNHNNLFNNPIPSNRETPARDKELSKGKPKRLTSIFTLHSVLYYISSIHKGIYKRRSTLLLSSSVSEK